MRGLVIATAAAFIVGCSVGLMGGILFMRFAVPPPHMRYGPGVPGGPPTFERRVRPRGPERMLPFLAEELNLTPEQRERVIAHLDRARREHDAVSDSLNARLAREMTPKQQTRWKEVEERTMRSRRNRR
jgi:hypothetical protein